MAEEPDDNAPSDNGADPLGSPQRPLPLDYREKGADPYQAKTPVGIQGLAGFLAWILGLVFVYQAANNRGWGSPFVDQQNIFVCSIAVALVGIGSLAIWLRLRFRWSGFLPGLLIGMAMTCLVPLGIVLIICGPGMLKH